jgi:sarcosine/dimethylglycine N-methyltransferase
MSDEYRGDLAAKILGALRAAGKDPGALTVEDLAPIDQLHARGREATLGLARLAGITAEMRVLDVGGGLGGPARTLASEFGCAVEVLDLTSLRGDTARTTPRRTPGAA